MSNPRAASRYAKALVDLSIERNILDRVKADMELVGTSISESREFRNFLASPVIKPAQKKTALKAIFSASVSNETALFLALLVSHGREGLTAEVIKHFTKMYLKAKGITRAQLTISIPLPDELRERFRTAVRQMSTEGEVLLEENVNPEIIGGFVLRVNDNQIDTSVSGQLRKLQQQYKDNPYMAEL